MSTMGGFSQWFLDAFYGDTDYECQCENCHCSNKVNEDVAVCFSCLEDNCAHEEEEGGYDITPTDRGEEWRAR